MQFGLTRVQLRVRLGAVAQVWVPGTLGPNARLGLCSPQHLAEALAGQDWGNLQDH